MLIQKKRVAHDDTKVGIIPRYYLSPGNNLGTIRDETKEQYERTPEKDNRSDIKYAYSRKTVADLATDFLSLARRKPKSRHTSIRNHCIESYSVVRNT